VVNIYLNLDSALSMYQFRAIAEVLVHTEKIAKQKTQAPTPNERCGGNTSRALLGAGASR